MDFEHIVPICAIESHSENILAVSCVYNHWFQGCFHHIYSTVRVLQNYMIILIITVSRNHVR